MTNAPTVPEPNDKDVSEWLEVNAIRGRPEYVPYADHGYKERFCHVSAKHHALAKGGKRVHGWAIWRWPDPNPDSGEAIIIAEHHSVWETPEGSLVDLTPPPCAAHVLFVRDDSATIVCQDGRFLMHTDRTNWPEVPRMLAGMPISAAFYPLDPNKQDVVNYAQSIGFDISRMATDPTHG
ncbi:hypothetical protein [Bradyrhizobium diazoefficiens]